jgi:hypothetical protein
MPCHGACCKRSGVYLQADRASREIVAPLTAALQPLTLWLQAGFASFVSKYSAGRSGSSSAGTAGLDAAPSALNGYAAAFNGTQLFLRSALDHFRATDTKGLLQSGLSRIRSILYA